MREYNISSVAITIQRG